MKKSFSFTFFFFPLYFLGTKHNLNEKTTNFYDYFLSNYEGHIFMRVLMPKTVQQDNC